MSDEVPSGRLSQIFDPLTNLQQPSSAAHHQNQQNQQNLQQQQHYHRHQQEQRYSLSRRRSNSSSPSPSTSGRATPASAGAASVGSAGSSNSSHHQQHLQQQQQHQQSYQYLTQTHNYFLRSQDDRGGAGVGGSPAAGGAAVHNYLHTFPSAANQSHYFQQQYLQQQQQYQQHYTQQPQHLMSPYLQHTQQQQHSLPPLYGTSHSLSSSPLLTKRATSFSGNIPLSRQQMENVNNTTAAAVLQRSQATAQSTPNSPRLMPRRQQKPPPIPAKPTGNVVAASSVAKDSSQVNPVSSLDGADAPWPHFSALTEYLDVHQVNNYSQGVPEINWQERCLDLQLELHRSKNQAGRIRDMLREKVSVQNFPHYTKCYIYVILFHNIIMILF